MKTNWISQTDISAIIIVFVSLGNNFDKYHAVHILAADLRFTL